MILTLAINIIIIYVTTTKHIKLGFKDRKNLEATNDDNGDSEIRRNLSHGIRLWIIRCWYWARPKETGEKQEPGR